MGALNLVPPLKITGSLREAESSVVGTFDPPKFDVFGVYSLLTVCVARLTSVVSSCLFNLTATRGSMTAGVGSFSLPAWAVV